MGSSIIGAREEVGQYELRSRFITRSEWTSLQGNPHLLGVFLFEEDTSTHQWPCISPGFSPFPQQPHAEIWCSNRPVTYQEAGPLKLACDGETLFGAISLPDSNDRLCDITREAYKSIFKNTERLGYPNLFRMWNYLPQINEADANNLERYKAFCRGRAEAFFTDRTFAETFLPAGTGVGSRSGGLNVAFMASRRKNQKNLENPVQVPAYHYPRQYGPRSPSFARGTWVNRGDGAGEFFVSGTASIVGHETVHLEDIVRQCETTLTNIERLISGENLSKHQIDQNLSLKDLQGIRVYVRRPEDLSTVRAICEARFGAEPVVYMGADICRADLLVEIEGWISQPPRSLEASPCS